MADENTPPIYSHNALPATILKNSLGQIADGFVKYQGDNTTEQSPADPEWRPLYAKSGIVQWFMASPGKIGWVSGKAMNNYAATIREWGGADLDNSPSWSTEAFMHGELPSGIWRKYTKTLYNQINGTHIPQPADWSMAGKQESIHYQQFMPSATTPYEDMPANWHTDEFLRLVVMGYRLPELPNDYWNQFAGFGDAYPFLPNAATWFLIPFDLIVKREAVLLSWELDEQAAKAAAKRLQKVHLADPPPTDAPGYDYISAQLDHPSLPTGSQNMIVRRSIPNYSEPTGGVDAFQKSRRWIKTTDGQQQLHVDGGGFTFSTDMAKQDATSRTKTIAVNKSFTSATIPFQIVIETTPGGSSDFTSQKVSGELLLRLHAQETIMSTRIIEYPVAGIKDDDTGWLSLWGDLDDGKLIPSSNLIGERDGATGWDSKNSDGGNVGTTFATNGTNKIALAWSGVIPIHALDFGVDRFTKIEFVLKVGVQGTSDGNFPEAQAFASAQPIFSRNIAKANSRISTEGADPVTFQADVTYLPAEVNKLTLTWDFSDGSDTVTQVFFSKTSGKTFHSFPNPPGPDPAEYRVVLKVDPDVPETSDLAEVFNDKKTGFSHDIRVVTVRHDESADTDQPSLPHDHPDAPPPFEGITFSNVQIGYDLEKNRIVCTWGTTEKMKSLVEIRNKGTTRGSVETTKHCINPVKLKNGKTYQIVIFGKLGRQIPDETYNLVYAGPEISGGYYKGIPVSQRKNSHIWEVTIPEYPDPQPGGGCVGSVAKLKVKHDCTETCIFSKRHCSCVRDPGCSGDNCSCKIICQDIRKCSDCINGKCLVYQSYHKCFDSRKKDKAKLICDQLRKEIGKGLCDVPQCGSKCKKRCKEFREKMNRVKCDRYN